MYEKSCELIYEMISKRISLKKEKHPKAKQFSLIDPKILNAICNNKRTPKKNPFLIPKGQIQPLLGGYKFKSEKEMMFGNKKEVDSYALSLFRLLLLDTLNIEINEKRPNSQYNANLLSMQKKELKVSSIRDIVNALTEYVPYAIYRMNKEMQYLYGESVKYTYDKAFDNLFETSLSETYEIPSDVVDAAIKWIFFRNHLGDIIKNEINELFKKIGNTNRLNLKLSEFVDIVLVPIIRIDSTDDIFLYGNRIYNSLTPLFDSIIEKKNAYEKLTSLSAYNELISDDYKTKMHDCKALFLANLKLACEYYQIQKEKNFDSIIENNWSPEMCLEPDEDEDIDTSSVITTIKDEDIDYDAMKNDAAD